MDIEGDFHQRKQIRFGNITFSEIEIKDIIKAWLVVSIAFGFILAGGFNDKLILTIIISALTVGIGFIAHELGHKILAQKYGAWAEFRAWNQMLIFGLLFAILLGLVFIAPGAVVIYGKTIGKNRNGKIAAMGPIMSFAIAIIFLGLMFTFPEGLMHIIGQYGFQINAWLGLFNLIPLAMFDGKKIWEWNKTAYILLAILAIGLMIVQYTISA